MSCWTVGSSRTKKGINLGSGEWMVVQDFSRLREQSLQRNNGVQAGGKNRRRVSQAATMDGSHGKNDDENKGNMQKGRAKQLVGQ